MIYQSKVTELGPVKFPEFLGERVYMKEFLQREGLPEELKRWQSTVDQMLDGIESDNPIYIMIDQSFVKKGTPHRRPGVHIDGYWNPEIKAHGGGHFYNPPNRHSPGHSPVPTHGPRNRSWRSASFNHPEDVILASSTTAARAYVGKYESEIGDMGDCKDIDVSSLDSLLLEQGKAYSGNITFLHESLPLQEDCFRTLVRLNMSGWSCN